MEVARLLVDGTFASVVMRRTITAGLVGATVLVEYAPGIWDGLTKTVVFKGSETKDVVTNETTVEIPWEVLQEPSRRLHVGFFGVDTDGKQIIPTIWADLGPIYPGTDPSGDTSTDPSLPVWGQIADKVEKLSEEVDELKQGGGGGPGTPEKPGADGEDGGYYTPAVTQLDEGTIQFAFNGSKPDMPAVDPVTVELPAGQGSGGNVDQVSVEPADDDIPKIFFGGALQQTKTEAVVPFRYISETDDFSGYAEIKAQGNSSMSYPKKNQTVKMFKDADCAEKMKVDFKGWGKQNKHVYKANWIDLSHARNVVSARLWADVVKSRANYAELPELFRTTPNQGAVDGFPVKVYAAGVYQGRYTLNIPKDKWTFNMDDELDEHCVLCGENYVSGCFRAAANINGNDWTDEIHDVVPASIKTRWNEVISFVMNSTDDEFRANLSQYFYVDSLIDYYLFGLASCGLDAFGKNQIYATYDGQKWIASMYDMDSTWGLYWNGSKFVATDYARTSYEDFVSSASSGEGNLLYIRLEQLFWSELQTRWAELKNGELSIENIINRFERFTDITPAELVKEDYASTTGGGKFTGIPSQTTNNIQQIRAFALARQAWTDEYVAGLTPEVEVPCTGISLSANELTFTAEGSQTLTATVTPDGCTDPVTWESDNTSVATVSGGVVTAIANGSATITAKCGEHSASCAVAVSGIAEGESGGDVSEELTWTATPEYKLNSSGELIAGDGYVSDMFTVEKGYSYSFSDGIPGAKNYVQMVLYNDDGTLAYYGEETGTQYANLLDDGTISKARLTVYANAGAVDLSTVKLVKHGIWSGPLCNIDGYTGDITVNNGKIPTKDRITLTKIPVEPGKTYRLSGKDGDTSTWKRIVVYDANGTMIQNTEGKNTTDALELTMPDNAAYVRCSVYGGGDANEFIEFAEVT